MNRYVPMTMHEGTGHLATPQRMYMDVAKNIEITVILLWHALQ